MRPRPLSAACLVVASMVALVGPPAATRLDPAQVPSSTSSAPAGSGTSTPDPGGSTSTIPSAVPTPELPEGPARPALAASDPTLVASLDQLAAASPPDTCITVSVDGVRLYAHEGDQPLIPASNEKLLTAGAALDLLGEEHRMRTSLVAAGAPVGGVVAGDLTIVGGGDPHLVSGPYASFRGLGDARPKTTIEDLVGQLRAAGVTRITGRVVGDEHRFDQVRQVPSWPANYLDERQSGNLSALGADDAYVLVREGERVVDLERAEDPALHTARLFTDVARFSGIVVDGEPGSGAAPAGAVEVAGLDSAPLRDLVHDLLLTSDNQASELVAKELGKLKGAGGSTAAGAAVVAQWAAGKQLASPGLAVVDGSGLDRGNRVSCNELVGLLDAVGGVEGTIGQGLPVAGESGTLAGRFRGSAAEGKLRAKTGSLRVSSSLAGFVELPEGRRATFAYIANADQVAPAVHGIQEQLGVALARYLSPCPGGTALSVIAPVSGYLAQLGALTAVPTAAATLPGTLAALEAVEGQVAQLGDRCLAADRAAVAVLVP